MNALDMLAEQRILEAQQRGEFDRLPGAGAPLVLDDDLLVPEELRVAYRMLKNAGFVPPELEANREIRRLEQLLDCTEDAGARSRLVSRISFLLSRGAWTPADPGFAQDYLAKIGERLEARRRRIRAGNN